MEPALRLSSWSTASKVAMDYLPLQRDTKSATPSLGLIKHLEYSQVAAMSGLTISTVTPSLAGEAVSGMTEFFFP